MLKLYRRHLKECPHRSITYRRCRCPIWYFGSVNRKRVRKSLDTTSWERGEEFFRSLDPEDVLDKMTIHEACERFWANCRSRKLAYETIGKYELLCRELKQRFKGLDVAGISVDDLESYREGWSLAPVSAGKKLERLKTFFKLCCDRGWRRSNPAASMKPPRAKQKPTLPFSDSEIEKVLWATEVYPNLGIHGKDNRARIRGFVNLLRYSGLRIRDAVMLTQENLTGNKLLMNTQETGQPVYLPLPETVVEELQKINLHGKYFFWSGNGNPKSAVADWQRSLAKLFKLAGVKNGYAHRFRDTFSVSLLQKGVALETVSVLLGHSSSRITAKHYNPWVKSRQIALEAEIQKAWEL